MWINTVSSPAPDFVFLNSSPCSQPGVNDGIFGTEAMSHIKYSTQSKFYGLKYYYYEPVCMKTNIGIFVDLLV